MRYAQIVRNHSCSSRKTLEAYLPQNYEVLQETDEWFIIGGSDGNGGWSLDGYVLPRLASGNITGREIDAATAGETAVAAATLDRGIHPHFSEDWLLDNLPEGWSYDCRISAPSGFTITATDGKTLFVPLRLLK